MQYINHNFQQLSLRRRSHTEVVINAVVPWTDVAALHPSARLGVVQTFPRNDDVDRG